MRFRSIGILLAGLGLTACGGSGGDTGVDLNAGDASFAGLVAETTRLQSYLSSAATTTLPSGETVNYDGVIVMGDDLDPTGGVSATGYIGQVDITVSFSAASTLDGTAGNFFEANLNAAGDPETEIGPVAGSLVFEEVAPFGTNVFNFTADGTVDGLVVDGEMSGAFAVSNAKAILGLTDTTTFLVDGTDFDAALIADDRSR